MLTKILSGRYYLVVSTSITYCIIVSFTTVYYIKHATPDKLEGFAMGLVWGLITFWGIFELLDVAVYVQAYSLILFVNVQRTQRYILRLLV